MTESETIKRDKELSCCISQTQHNYSKDLVHDGNSTKERRKKLPSVGGGYPPIPINFFGQNDFPLRGGGYPPIPPRKKSAKNSYFLAKFLVIFH